jgi:oxygen-dependent protoporphyrinogen oxidase
VEECPDEVRVAWRDADGEHEQAFAGCVIAAPADSTRAIHTPLPAESGAFLNGIRYTPLVTANVGLTSPPSVRASFVLTPRALAPDVIGLILEHNKVPGRAPAGRGHIVIGASTELSRRLWDASDEDVTAGLVQAAQPVLPLRLDDVELGHIARWPAVSLISPPGYYRELARFRAEHDARYARIRLASDYFCTSNVNSATAAGERAAHRLSDRLRATVGHRRAAA